MTPSIVIAIALSVPVPVFIVWTALSFLVWRGNERPSWPHDYRLAVTAFLGMTAIFAANIVRIRFKFTLWGWNPVFSDWPTAAIDCLWTATVIWATIILYGRSMHLIWIAIFDGEYPSEPYLEQDDEGREAEIERRHEQIGYLSKRLRQIANELNEIVARVEGDDPVILPEDSRRVRERP